MQRSRIRLLTFLAAVVGGSLAGCGGGGGGAAAGPAPAPGPAPTPAPAPAPRSFAYVATAGQIAMFRVEQDGNLSPLGSLDSGTPVKKLAVHPTGKFAYAVNDAGGISAFTIHPETGMLAPNGTFPAEASAASIEIDPTGRYAFAPNQAAETISMWRIAENGNLEDNGSLPMGGATFCLTVHPTANCVLAGGGPALKLLAIDSGGALRTVDSAGIPIPFQIAISPGGKYVYTNNNDASISVLSFDQDAGTLEPISTDVVGSGGPLVFNAAGTRAYMASPQNVAILAFTVSELGELSVLQTVLQLPEPVAVALAPSGQCLYSCHTADNTLVVYLLESTGRLNQPGSTISLGASPRAITVATIVS